ncbi:MAG: class IV adenylate cyclase [Acidobacteriota bacterium]|nr:class IV adenylate cyclase [Acidobacteriota bacterium]
MPRAEIELKFPVDDPAQLEARLTCLGFSLVTPRTFEHNTLFDTPARTLRSSRQILRLRRYGDLWTLTHKRQPGAQDDHASRYKTRIETETHLDDGPAMAEIFEQLGLSPVFRYEKFRTEWLAPDQPSAHVVLDETPIGTFAELEGPPAWIDRTLDALGVDSSRSITDSYGRLFLAWKDRTGSPAEDLTFDQITAPAAALEPLAR